MEHISNLHKWGGWLGEFANGLRRDKPIWFAFLRVFGWATMAAIAWSFLLMAWSPRVYSSRVVFRVLSPEKTTSGEMHAAFMQQDAQYLSKEAKIITSPGILADVIANLHLHEKLGDQPNHRRRAADDYECLNKMIKVSLTQMTSLLEISVSNPDPALAAQIANAIPDSYRAYRLEQEPPRECGMPVTVLDPARAARKPDFPNYGTFFRWLTEGTLVASLGGLAAAVLAVRKRQAFT